MKRAAKKVNSMIKAAFAVPRMLASKQSLAEQLTDPSKSFEDKKRLLKDRLSTINSPRLDVDCLYTARKLFEAEGCDREKQLFLNMDCYYKFEGVTFRGPMFCAIIPCLVGVKDVYGNFKKLKEQVMEEVSSQTLDRKVEYNIDGPVYKGSAVGFLLTLKDDAVPESIKLKAIRKASRKALMAIARNENGMLYSIVRSTPRLELVLSLIDRGVVDDALGLGSMMQGSTKGKVSDDDIIDTISQNIKRKEERTDDEKYITEFNQLYLNSLQNHSYNVRSQLLDALKSRIRFLYVCEKLGVNDKRIVEVDKDDDSNNSMADHSIMTHASADDNDNSSAVHRPAAHAATSAAAGGRRSVVTYDGLPPLSPIDRKTQIALQDFMDESHEILCSTSAMSVRATKSIEIMMKTM